MSGLAVLVNRLRLFVSWARPKPGGLFPRRSSMNLDRLLQEMLQARGRALRPNGLDSVARTDVRPARRDLINHSAP
jgi:hypothetical protein